MAAEVTLLGDKLKLSCPFGQRNMAKMVMGYEWSELHKGWLYPAEQTVLDDLMDIFSGGIVVSKDAIKFCEDRSTPQWSGAVTEPVEPMPLKAGINPYQHQVVAYNMALKAFGEW